VPAWVEGDPVRLEQVVTNLLGNALKFTPAERRVTLSTSLDHGRAVITVSDTGVEISSDFLPMIFQPFAQADPKFGGRAGGLGLGLTLTKRLVELHGGEITVARDGPGLGATFVVSLPAISAPTASPEAPTTRNSGRGRRIVVIEDNDDNRGGFQPSPRADLSDLAAHHRLPIASVTMDLWVSRDTPPPVCLFMYPKRC
jgi:hypothetical protein